MTIYIILSLFYARWRIIQYKIKNYVSDFLEYKNSIFAFWTHDTATKRAIENYSCRYFCAFSTSRCRNRSTYSLRSFNLFKRWSRTSLESSSTQIIAVIKKRRASTQGSYSVENKQIASSVSPRRHTRAKSIIQFITSKDTIARSYSTLKILVKKTILLIIIYILTKYYLFFHYSGLHIRKWI